MELLNLAIADLATAQALIAAQIVRKENILFHIQQCVEKALKAKICWIGKPVPLVHDLTELLREIPNASEMPHADELYDLTQFATIRRYEEGVAIIEPEEIAAVYAAAEDVVRWVQLALGR